MFEYTNIRLLLTVSGDANTLCNIKVLLQCNALQCIIVRSFRDLVTELKKIPISSCISASLILVSITLKGGYQSSEMYQCMMMFALRTCNV